MSQNPAASPRRRAWTCALIALCCVTVVATLVVIFTVARAAPAMARSVPSAAAGEPGPRAGWRWPLQPPPAVVRGFTPPAQRWDSGHRGVDLAASAGQPIYATGHGVVTFAGVLAGRGVVAVAHGALRTTYEPVRASVVAGERVAAGQQLGVLEAGPGHCAPRACLHWGLLRGADYLNPLLLVGGGPSRLLPLWRPVTGASAAGSAPAAGTPPAAGPPAAALRGRAPATQSANRVPSAPAAPLAAVAASATAGIAVGGWMLVTDRRARRGRG